MRKSVSNLLMACFTMALAACVSTDDALLKTVPIGSGTSTLGTFEFVKCVKAKWTPMGLPVREYGLGADTQAVSVRGAGGVSTLLAVAQQSAGGTGYTIYGDIAAASRYVAPTHACD